MNDVNKKVNARNEWARSESALKAAKVLAQEELWEDATSRAYYAAFHATQAILLTGSLQPQSHRGTLFLFAQHFVRKGLIEPEYSQILARAAKYREEADYRHAMVFTKEQTEQAIQEVEKLLKRVKQFLRSAGYLG